MSSESPDPRALGRRAARNAIVAAGQVLVSGALFLALYRYLLGTIGPGRLGIWSLVLAATNASRLSGLGLQGTAVRYVARYLATGARATAARIVETAMLATAMFIGAAAVVGYPLIATGLAHLVDPRSLAEATMILPYALASVWLNVVGGVVQSGLDGCQRADVRSGTTIVANVVYVTAACAMVPSLGLVGLALAQVGQSALLLSWSWVRLRRLLPELPRVPRAWDRGLFREMVSYGANFQAESIFAMLHDPIVKALLSHFGGLASVGYFEMASRLILQVKALATAGFQVLVPVIADYHESDPDRVSRLYATAAQMLVYVTVPAFGAVTVAAPLIGRLWIGHQEPDFVAYLEILSVAWLLNALSVPAMSANFGTGHIGWHTIAAFLIAVVNVVLGVPAGWLWGSRGVVLSWAAALAAGSMLVGLNYHRRTGTPMTALFSPASIQVAAATAASVAIASVLRLLAAEHSGATDLGRLSIAPCAYAALMAVPLWRHASRRRLVEAVIDRLPRRRTGGA